MQRSRRQLIFCRSAEGAGADNHIANGVAVFHSICEVGFEEPGRLRIRRAVKRRAQIRKRFRQAQILVAVGFDGAGDSVQSLDGISFCRFYLGGIPFHFERWKIEEQQAQR